MVRQLTGARLRDCGALLLILVAGGGWLWHLLACTDSPMAFSPDGKNLAFVTMEPYGQEDLLAAGPHAYRLMILAEGERLRVIEATADHMLTGPAFSPDGKQVCYLRIPLLSDEKRATLKLRIDERKKQKKETAEFQWAPSPASQPSVEDLTLPPAEASAQWITNHTNAFTAPATLVVRDLATGAVASETTVDLFVSEEPDKDLWGFYVLTRLQYSPDGRWIYLSAGTGNVVMSINPFEKKRRILAVGLTLAALSPDGATVAGLQESTISFMQTNGAAAVYRRLDIQEVSLGGLCWINENSVAIVTTETDKKQLVLQTLRSDGSIGKRTLLARPEQIDGKDVSQVEWAVGRDGAHMVISSGPNVYFMQADGTVIKEWHGTDKEILAQPTFTPDSQHVAFKYLVEEESSYVRTAAIIFFTPQGRELSRVAVPGIDASTTRPASPPATQPS